MKKSTLYTLYIPWISMKTIIARGKRGSDQRKLHRTRWMIYYSVDTIYILKSMQYIRNLIYYTLLIMYTSTYTSCIQVPCTLYTVQYYCTLYSLQYTVYIVHCTVFIIQSTVKKRKAYYVIYRSIKNRHKSLFISRDNRHTYSIKYILTLWWYFIKIW